VKDPEKFLREHVTREGGVIVAHLQTGEIGVFTDVEMAQKWVHMSLVNGYVFPTMINNPHFQLEDAQKN